MANENPITPQPGSTVVPAQTAPVQQAVAQQTPAQTAPVQQAVVAQPVPQVVPAPLPAAAPPVVPQAIAPAQIVVQPAPVQAVPQVVQQAVPVVAQVPVQQAPQPQPQPVQRPPVMQAPVMQQAPQQMPQQMRPGQPGQPFAGQQMPGQPMQNQQQPGQPLRPGQPATRKPPNPKRLITGCIGCFGGAIVLFVILVLVFVAQTSATGDNPLAKSFGTDAGTFINTLITIVNLIFGALSVVLFVLVMIGIFRFLMARKDDKDSKKKGLTLAGISGLILLITVITWVGLYAFMSSKTVKTQKVASTMAIVTTPANVLQQIAPFEVSFQPPPGAINTAKYDILTYGWSFGDGGTDTIANPKHTYVDMGKKSGTFDVTLDISKSDKATKEVTLDNYKTTVTISKVLSPEFTMDNQKGPAPLTVNFDATSSNVTSGKVSAYDWDFKGTNTFSDANGDKVSYTFDRIGTYKVSLRISDEATPPVFRVISKDVTVEGSNIPVAVIEIPTTDGKYMAGTQYSLLGEKSSSPVGNVNKYSWDFGDGTAKANTRTAGHTWKTAGSYEVILEITDDKGTKAQASQKITVEKPSSAPTAVITTVPGPVGDKDKFIGGTIPFEVSFDASKSQSPDKNIVEYKWDFDGDGTFDDSGEKVTYVYKKDGVFNATLTVVDANNLESKATQVVKVGAQPLQAKITANPVEGVAPLTVIFDATGSSYPNGKIVSYEWDFGDGGDKQIGVGQITYKYTKIGTFTAKVTAIASDNSRSTSETPVNVRPVTLTACFTATPEQGNAPLVVELDPKCSAGTVAKYSWDFGDNTTSRTRKPTHTYNKAGSYEVTLEVSDSQNVLNKFTKTILVTGSI
jgi:PKD repeat protein